ncbi:MAG TPA: heme NO-binding domain-containing protein [Ktedonosporobacter sp.]|nr:heme NO-binding domain-containing protein [Ktedonosporobacter sp.]
MQGLIFVTWEKFLTERFGDDFFQAYRKTIGETVATAPLASRVYDDATLLAGVGAACKLSGKKADTLLREYGSYFMLNSLTRHLCAYLLTLVHSGKELLLVMSQAHHQLSRTPDGLTPPLFGYEALPGDPEGFVLIYDSPRKLCSLLLGTIEGAAALFDEKVRVVEQTCMHKGASACRFKVHFYPSSRSALPHREAPEQQARHLAQRHLAEQVFAVLPNQEGATLSDLQGLLRSRQVNSQQLRPSVLLKAVQHLQYVGLAASTANHPGDGLIQRRYWRAPTSDVEENGKMRY